MSDLTPDSPEVRLVGARLQDEGETIEASAELCARAFSSTPNRLEAVAAEHTRLVAQAVKAARIEALREAHSAILTLQRRCKETPEGQSASMIYGHAGIAIELLMQSEETPRPIDKEESK